MNEARSVSGGRNRLGYDIRRRCLADSEYATHVGATEIRQAGVVH